MDEFPGNSRRPAAPREEQPVEEKNLEKVVTGRVVRRKKPLGRRIKDAFFSADSSSVLGYLLREVLIPALQTTATEMVTQGIEKAVYGEVRSAHRTVRGVTASRTHISYDRPSGPVRPSTTYSSPPARRPVSQPTSFDFGEVVLESKIDAQVVVDSLYAVVEKYGHATVADLNDLTEHTSVYTDHKWGWTDLTNMTVRRVREGYVLVLPDPEDLR